VLTIALAWWQYPEPYNFFQETVSSLGGNLSIYGSPNATSSLIFTIGFFLCGIIAFVVALIYLINKQLFWHSGKAILALFIAVGALGTAIPRDHVSLSLLHGLGAAIFIGAFGFFNGVLQLLRYNQKYHPKQPEAKKTFDFYLDLTMVYVTLIISLLYLIILVLDASFDVELGWMTHELAQKIVLIISSLAIFLLDKDDI